MQAWSLEMLSSALLFPLSILRMRHYLNLQHLLTIIGGKKAQKRRTFKNGKGTLVWPKGWSHNKSGKRMGGEEDQPWIVTSWILIYLGAEGTLKKIVTEQQAENPFVLRLKKNRERKKRERDSSSKCWSQALFTGNSGSLPHQGSNIFLLGVANYKWREIGHAFLLIGKLKHPSMKVYSGTRWTQKVRETRLAVLIHTIIRPIELAWSTKFTI